VAPFLLSQPVLFSHLSIIIQSYPVPHRTVPFRFVSPFTTFYFYCRRMPFRRMNARRRNRTRTKRPRFTRSRGGQQWTSTHQRTIHWMPVTTQLWINLNWVDVWFHLGNRFYRK
jgi:hypothetical protein